LATAEAPGVNTLVGERPTVVWAAARGANVADVDGNRYLDLTSGFGAAAVGHRHPDVEAAVVRQSQELLHGLGDVAAHPTRIALAERLADLAPMPDARVYFAVSGADAVEIAVETAVLSTGRSEVLCFDAAYHGTSATTRAFASRDVFREPFGDTLRSGVHRLAWGCDGAELETFLEHHGRQLACVLFEPIAGREGIHLPPPGWLARLARACREHGALVVADEIFTGFGRTGTLFATTAEGVEADLLCCGKALGGGLPIAAVLGRRELLEAWAGPWEALHTGTFLANPLACAAALAVLDVIERDDLAGKAERTAEAVAPKLEVLAKRAAVRQIRGRGLLWGVELASAELAAQAVERCRDQGLLLLTCGPHGDTLELVPPLNITPAQLGCALDILAGVIEELPARALREEDTT
jgi:4-aminobutyrate aminotransferase-like enzyme